MTFRDRTEAGRLLAARLVHFRRAAPVVLALPRGGVPVAAPIADALEAPLDLLLVRKLGAPGEPELAIGAVVEGDPPLQVLNPEIVAALSVGAGALEAEIAAKLREMERGRQLWRKGKPASVAGRTAILVDDGIATGATARVALLALARAGAARRVLAVPVAPADTAEALRQECEEAVFLSEPARFGSVNAFYREFAQVEDAEVTALLKARSDRERAADRNLP